MKELIMKFNKKGAMFCLDFEPLRKQFGELFLAKRQSEAPQGANGSCGLIKHGAMFGLDARIALAIFGALSVISGAALYSAIQQAKVVQWQTYFNELAKASEAYYLDTGREIPLTSNTLYDTENLFLSINDLVLNEDNVAGWQGPYWQTIWNDTGINDFHIRDNMTRTINDTSSIQVWLRKKSEWATLGIFSNELCAVDSEDCSEWLVLQGTFSGRPNILKLFNLLDEKVDNGDGFYSGNIRLTSPNNEYLFVKGRNRVYRGV